MRAIVLALTLLAAPASATPTYLDCSFIRGDGVAIPQKITADEPAQTVTVAVNARRAERLPAVFSAGTVQWSDRLSGGTWTLSRTDLTLRRVMVIAGKTYDEGGTCKVESVAQRAF